MTNTELTHTGGLTITETWKMILVITNTVFEVYGSCGTNITLDWVRFIYIHTLFYLFLQASYEAMLLSTFMIFVIYIYLRPFHFYQIVIRDISWHFKMLAFYEMWTSFYRHCCDRNNMQNVVLSVAMFGLFWGPHLHILTGSISVRNISKYKSHIHILSFFLSFFLSFYFCEITAYLYHLQLLWHEQGMRLMWESWCECHLILKTSPCVSVSEKAIKAVDCFLSKGYIS